MDGTGCGNSNYSRSGGISCCGANYLPKLQRESDRTGLGRRESRAAPIAVARAGTLSEMSQAIGMVGCSLVYRLTTVRASAYWMPGSRHSRRTASGREGEFAGIVDSCVGRRPTAAGRPPESRASWQTFFERAITYPRAVLG
jgi:hypothetical protein